jgi:hypothetical protein
VPREEGLHDGCGPVVRGRPDRVRLKISALWVAMLFLFAYGDIFGFFRPGRIEEVG